MLHAADPLLDERVKAIKYKMYPTMKVIVKGNKKVGVHTEDREPDKLGEVWILEERYFVVKFPKGKNQCFDYEQFGKKVVPK